MVFSDERDKAAVDRIKTLMRVGVPEDQLERDLQMRGYGANDVIRILDAVKRKVRAPNHGAGENGPVFGGASSKSMTNSSPFSFHDEESMLHDASASFVALPGMSIEGVPEHMVSKLAPASESAGDTDGVGDGFLKKIGIDRSTAHRWSYSLDPLENDQLYKQYVRLVRVGVPRDTIIAKLQRDGVDRTTVNKYAKIAEFRKQSGPPRKMPQPASSSSSSATAQRAPTQTTAGDGGAGFTGSRYPMMNSRRQRHDGGRGYFSKSGSRNTHAAIPANSTTASSKPATHQVSRPGVPYYGPKSAMSSVATYLPSRDAPWAQDDYEHGNSSSAFDKIPKGSIGDPTKSGGGQTPQTSSHVPTKHSAVTRATGNTPFGAGFSIHTTQTVRDYSASVAASMTEESSILSSWKRSMVAPHAPFNSYGQQHTSVSTPPPAAREPKPWHRMTPASPSGRSKAHRNVSNKTTTSHAFSNVRGDSLANPQTKAALQATGLSKEVAETLAMALGAGVSQSMRPQLRAGADSDGASSNDSRKENLGSSNVAFREARTDSLRAESRRLEQIWSDFSMRRHNVAQSSDAVAPSASHSQMNRQEEFVSLDAQAALNEDAQYQKPPPPPLAAALFNEAQPEESVRQNPEESAPEEDSVAARFQELLDMCSAIVHTSAAAVTVKPIGDGNETSSSLPTPGATLPPLLAPAVPVLQDGKSVALRAFAGEMQLLLSGAEEGLRQLALKKEAAEKDLRDLQDSVKRSSSLLIDKAHEQQATALAREEEIRSLRERVEVADDELQQALERAEEAEEAASEAQTVAARAVEQAMNSSDPGIASVDGDKTRALLRDAEEVVERQQAYIAELEANLKESALALQSEREKREVKQQTGGDSENGDKDASGSTSSIMEEELNAGRDEQHRLQLESLQASNTKLRQQLTSLLETGRKQEELDQYHAAEAMKHQQASELQEELEALREDLFATRAERAQLKGQLESAEATATAEAKAAARAKAEVRAAVKRAEVAEAAEAEASALADTVAEVAAEKATLRREAASSKQRVAAAEADVRRLQEKVAMLAREREDLEAQGLLDVTSGDANNTEGGVSPAAKATIAGAEAMRRAEAVEAASEKALADAESAKLDAEDKNLAAQVTIKQLQVTIAQQNRKISDLEDLTTVKKELGESEAGSFVVEDLRKSLLLSREEANRLREQVEVTTAENERDGARIAELEQDLIALANSRTKDKDEQSVNDKGGDVSISSASTYSGLVKSMLDSKRPSLPPPRDVAEHQIRLYEAQISDLVADKEESKKQVADLQARLTRLLDEQDAREEEERIQKRRKQAVDLRGGNVSTSNASKNNKDGAELKEANRKVKHMREDLEVAKQEAVKEAARAEEAEGALAAEQLMTAHLGKQVERLQERLTALVQKFKSGQPAGAMVGGTWKEPVAMALPKEAEDEDSGSWFDRDRSITSIGSNATAQPKGWTTNAAEVMNAGPRASWNVVMDAPTPMIQYVGAINRAVAELKQAQIAGLVGHQQNAADKGVDDELDDASAVTTTLNVEVRVEELQLKSTRATMAFIKASVLQLTRRDAATFGRIIERAYDSRGCANMIKEGYQNVKNVLNKTLRGKRPVRNEVWPLTEESIAASAEHREMAPALILMVIGFENLSPIYHGKIAKSQELNLNMHWIIKIADHIGKTRLATQVLARRRKASPDVTVGERGRQRSRNEGSSSNWSLRGRSGSTGSRKRSESVGTRFSVGSDGNETGPTTRNEGADMNDSFESLSSSLV